MLLLPPPPLPLPSPSFFLAHMSTAKHPAQTLRAQSGTTLQPTRTRANQSRKAVRPLHTHSAVAVTAGIEAILSVLADDAAAIAKEQGNKQLSVEHVLAAMAKGSTAPIFADLHRAKPFLVPSLGPHATVPLFGDQQ